MVRIRICRDQENEQLEWYMVALDIDSVDCPECSCGRLNATCKHCNGTGDVDPRYPMLGTCRLCCGAGERVVECHYCAGHEIIATWDVSSVGLDLVDIVLANFRTARA